ncbi:RICIN domain-containing protein [Streptomyces niveiscabiei]|uniref:RICIN domain-containing protein n=1 Tax=Streptomyces niveiscabiei TaxID=164115 RepID=UPI0029A7F2DF|nr:RICIN domain-containing protein [Streptomyces niveiscabiei]MDX3386266.1 RICIN domain-containing protein [Streptomyces niveiscabiei]
MIPLVGILVTVLTVPSPPSAAPPPSGTPSSSAPAPGSATPPASPPPLPAGLFRLTNVDSRMCLSPPPGNPIAAAGLIQSDCDGRPDQFWSFRYDTARHGWKLVSRNSGKCVALPAGSGDGEQALQEDCDGDTWLLWRT